MNQKQFFGISNCFLRNRVQRISTVHLVRFLPEKPPEKDVLRRFGNELVGVIPWGTHLCQFYETKQDLIDILVPYFAEGLHSNEFCMWVTSPPLEVDEAKKALQEAVPDLEKYAKNGQIEIISYNDWYLLGGKFDSNRVLRGWVKKEKSALKHGFEGLRLTGNTLWVNRDLWKCFVDYEEAINSVIGKHRMIALCTYCLTCCSGLDVVDVVRNHVGTLIKQVDRLYLVEDAARRKVANGALKLSEQKYCALFENMQNGFGYHKVLFDEFKRPVDYVFLEVNDSFERLTGLKREKILGKRATQVLPGIEKDPANWIGVYGKVALTGEPVKFESYSGALQRWYLVSAYCPERGYFVATFEDVTERKKSVEALSNEKSMLKGIMENACIMLAYFDLQFNFVAVNSAYAKCSGHAVEGLIGKNHFALFPNKENQAVFEKVRDTGESVTFFDKPFEFADQPERGVTYWDWTLAPIKDKAGNVQGLLLSLSETTFRKKAEEKIESLSRFPLENPNVVFRVGADGTLLYLNPAGRFLLDEWKSDVGEAVPARIGLLVAEALASGSNINFEEKYGNHFFVFTLSPIKNEGYVNFYGLDITELKEMEKSVSVLNERFDMAQRAAGVGVWDWDITTGNIEWSLEMFYLFGLDPQKISASFETWNSVLHPEDKKQVATKIDEALKNHSFLYSEYRIVWPDGQIHWINALGKGVYDNQNKPTRMMGICLDVTERKKAEELLHEHETIIKSTSDAVFSTDNSFRLKTWNNAAEQIFGWAAEEVIGKTTSCVFSPIYPTLGGDNREQAMDELMDKGFWSGEIVYYKKGGSTIPVSLSASLVKDENGNISGVVAIARDISARKSREKMLKETQRDLKHAQFVAKLGSWRLDTQQNVLLWSDENHRIFAVPKGTPLTYETFLGTVHPDDRGFVDESWKAGLQGEQYDIEHRIIADGKVKWVREKAVLEYDENGTLLGGFGTTQDITDMVEMREKLRYYTEHLEELVKEKTKQLHDAERLAAIGQTAGMIGHDIRNPLQSIDGAVYLAKEDVKLLPDGTDEKEELEEILDLIKEQVAYIDHMVADLQDFARTPKPQFEKTDIQETLMDSLSTVEIPEKVKVNMVSTEDNLKLNVDAAHMKRVLVNLIKNAVQAMPDGGELTIMVLQNDKELWIRIEDTGVGINQETKQKIFTPLFTTKSKGQGFGLAVCKKLIDANGGEITFDSVEGMGSTFTIKLPLTREA